ncbi:MAG TPA: hypothetical protein VJ695_06990 [Nitrososphaera sp.]|nr:hypothetical protein [Nitrososphaera sp.]
MVKYKGKCSACGKEISAGQYALWSKSSKAIKHSQCNAPEPATTEKRHTTLNRQQLAEAEAVDCFICGRPVARSDSGFEEALDYSRQAVSQAYICNVCLEDPNTYQNYQNAFIEKVHRLAKVKI